LEGEALRLVTCFDRLRTSPSSAFASQRPFFYFIKKMEGEGFEPFGLSPFGAESPQGEAFEGISPSIRFALSGQAA